MAVIFTTIVLLLNKFCSFMASNLTDVAFDDSHVTAVTTVKIDLTLQ